MLGRKELTDSHVHLVLPLPAAAGQPGFVSDRMRRSPLFRLVARRYGVRVDEPERLAEAYRCRLLTDLRQSRHVGVAVVLALDGVYDQRGDLDVGNTHLYVSNDAVLDLAREVPEVLAGVSINPCRRGALAEVERVAAAGAALVKWLPNAQQFDPADRRHRPFYAALSASGLPLLVHSGVEFSVVGSHWSHGGDPERWRLALDEGVTVVAAHAGSCGRFFPERHLASLQALAENYPNLLADSSALNLPSRAGMLPKLLQSQLLRSRLTFGTDYPLPCFPSLLLLRCKVRDYLRVRRETNPFDRQVELFAALGWAPTSAPLEAVLGRDRARASGSS